MGEPGAGGDPPARSPHHKAQSHQKGFGHLRHRLGLFTDGDGQGRQANRTAAELRADGLQNCPVQTIQTERIDLEQVKGITGSLGSDQARSPDLGVVTHPAQQTIGDTRCAA